MSFNSQSIVRTKRVPFDGLVNNFLHVLKTKKDQLLPNCKVKYSLGLSEEWLHKSMIRYLPWPTLVSPCTPSYELHHKEVSFLNQKII